jgi:hypothetical protein
MENYIELKGTCSCYQFVFPEVLIDMEEGV